MAVTFKKSSKDSKGSEFLSHLGGPVTIKSQSVKGKVEAVKTVKDGPSKVLLSEETTLNKGVLIPAPEMCVIMAGGSQTVNLGNYESAKISVSISMPCVKADINETYDFATNWVSEKITEAVEQIKN